MMVMTKMLMIISKWWYIQLSDDMDQHMKILEGVENIPKPNT